MPSTCIIDFPRENGSHIAGRFENPREILIAWNLDDITPLLHKVEEWARQGCWVVGMVTYEAAPAFDPAFQTFPALENLPLAAFAVFDKAPIANTTTNGNFACSPWKNDTSRAAFEHAISTIRDDIAAGRYYQTNYTTRLTADLDGNAEAFFAALREAQPGGYSFFLDWGAWKIASVSPELFFAWDAKTGALTTRPMKGTAAPDTPAETLATSAKDRAENLMIVDLLRNDIARVARDVRVPELFAVQNLPTARQMTSTITGITRHGTGLADIFRSLFPCGSVTGAPKIAAMQAIRMLETSPRGAYCGTLGIIEPGGNATFSVGIRSVTIAGNQAMCGIGSGITWDSNAADEYAENQVKQRFLWRASAPFDLLETLRLENGGFWLLDRHIKRMERSAAHFGFVFDTHAVRRELENTAHAHATGLHRVRLLANRRGAVRTEIFPLEPNPEFAIVQMAGQPIDSDDEFLRHKTTHRAVYDTFNPTQADIFDTLLYNERGEITEFTRGNVVAELDGKLFTPPESCGLLPGTLRADMLECGEIGEHVLTRDDLNRATSLFFINALRGSLKVEFYKPPA